MILPIAIYGHPVLKEKAMEVEAGDADIESLISNMIDTMHAAGGAGLAAPQVGQSKKIFVTGPLGEEEDKDHVFINPEIVQYTGLFKGMMEGCLSIPGLQCSLLRQEQVRIKYQNEKFEWKEENYTGFAARVLQHEFDHLEGILMTDRINNERKKSLRSFLYKLAQGKSGIKVDYPVIQ